jgi:hypothetical protein
MLPETKSTIRSRELGDALRLAMERANLSGKHAAHVLGWSETKVSRMLTGRQLLREADVASLLTLCRVTGDERERLLALAREHHHRGWLQQYGSSLPEQLQTLINHENRATAIYQFEPCFIPGLLQTSDYAQALLERSATIPADEVGGRVQARIGRQSLFSREHRPTFRFFLHEQALRLPVGGSAVMSNQLHHLLQMSVRTYIAIRVIPIAFGAHAGTAGAFRLMEFDEVRPVIYIEEQTAGHFLEEPGEIASYRKIFTSFANSALGKEESKDRIAELAVGLYADREDPDAR